MELFKNPGRRPHRAVHEGHGERLRLGGLLHEITAAQLHGRLRVLDPKTPKPPRIHLYRIKQPDVQLNALLADFVQLNALSLSHLLVVLYFQVFLSYGSPGPCNHLPDILDSQTEGC